MRCSRLRLGLVFSLRWKLFRCGLPLKPIRPTIPRESVTVRRAVVDDDETKAFWELAENWPWPLEATKFEWKRRRLGPHDTFEPSLVFPGEGPKRALRRELAPHA
eukprot:129401-Amphidinium_carterae.1